MGAIRTNRTAAEAKAIADRKDIWHGQKWMLQPKEANEYRVRGDFEVLRKDQPLLTSSLETVEKYMDNGQVTITRNPYLKPKETDFRRLIAERDSKDWASPQEDDEDLDIDLEEEEEDTTDYNALAKKQAAEALSAPVVKSGIPAAPSGKTRKASPAPETKKESGENEQS